MRERVQVERLYVIDCGWAHAEDQSLWSPASMSRRTDRFLRQLLSHPSFKRRLSALGYRHHRPPHALTQGQTVAQLRQTWHRNQTLIDALAANGVKPADVHYVAISHVHPDHVGNIDEFPRRP